eukprot:TRINITY_DN16077_c0_g1_i6.p2 TRINITY_DN16077_c0_g1~~TRINITY_DN16077_c0_g1_i6.p2  ORF type:complete len:133 (-),score=13.24 TRINITY_DN16077_c0_g1_i6:170-568(-)
MKHRVLSVLMASFRIPTIRTPAAASSTLPDPNASSVSAYDTVAPARDVVPGPGQYEEKNTLADKGHYVLSTIAGPQTQRFAKGEKGKYVSPVRSVPGPGAYRAVSEFGYYSTLPANTQSHSRNHYPGSKTMK